MFGFFEDENEAYINTYRQKYPQYKDLDDEVLADALYRKKYSDIDRDKFMSAFLGKPDTPAWNQDEPPPMDWNREDDQFPQRDIPEPEEAEVRTSPFINDGQQYDVPLDGYDSEEAAIDAFLEGKNEPTNISPAPEGSTPGATIQQEAPTPEPEEPSPTDLTDFGVTAEQLNAPAIEKEPDIDAVSQAQAPQKEPFDIWADKDRDDDFARTDKDPLKDYEEQPDDGENDLKEFILGRWKTLTGATKREAGGGLEQLADIGEWLEGGITEDKTPYDTIEKLKADGQKLLEEGQESKPEGVVGQWLTDVTDGSLNMIPAIMVGAITKNPNLALGEMGVEVYTGAYADAKDKGKDPTEATFYALRQTLYEVGAEKLFGFFDNLSGARGVKEWFKQALREAGSEVVTSIAQQTDEVWMEGEPWKGWGEFIKRTLYEGSLGFGMGGVLSIHKMFGKDSKINELPPVDPNADPLDLTGKTYKGPFYNELEALNKELEEKGVPGWEKGDPNDDSYLVFDDRTPEQLARDKEIEDLHNSIQTKLNENAKDPTSKSRIWAKNLLKQISDDYKSFLRLMNILKRMQGQQEYEDEFIAKHNLSLGNKIDKIREISNQLDIPGFNSSVATLQEMMTYQGQPYAAGPDEEEETPIQQVDETRDPAEVIANKTHDQLMQNPIYKKLFNASDLGSVSQDHSRREAAAREAYIRKARKIQKWKPKLEAEQEMRQGEAEQAPGTVESATKERVEREDEVESSGSLLPEGYDPFEMIYANDSSGVEQDYTIDEAASIVEKFDARDEGQDSIKITGTDSEGESATWTITREERDDLMEQLDIYRKEFEASETIESPRSEERESRPLKDPPEKTSELMDVNDLDAEPKLMQYKSGTDNIEGANANLEGIEQWNPAAGGVLTVWEDASGRRIVGNGHQRRALLKRLQAKGIAKDAKLNVVVYRESEGYTAEDVRTMASLVNIAEGSGTAMDAAKLIRDLTPEESAKAIAQLPPNSALVRDAFGLAKLGEDAFQVVVNELISPTYGSMVGNAFEESEQTAAMQILIKSKPSSIAEAAAMISDIQAGGFVKSEQGGLFGGVEMESLIKERAQILTSAEKGLKKNVAIFNALTKNEETITEAGENKLDTETNKAIVKDALSIMDRALRTINTNPELNNELNTLAKRLKAREITRNKAAKSFVEAAKSYKDRSSNKPVAGPSTQTEREGSEPAEVETKTEQPKKKKPSEIKVETEFEVEETGEVVSIEENAGQALLKLDKRIAALDALADCIRS